MIEQAAGVGRLAVADRHAAAGGDPGKEGILQGSAGQQGHIVGGGIVLLGIQAAGGDKVGVVHAQGGRPAVHLRHKGFHTAGNAYRGRPGGVIAAGQQHAHRQRVQGDGIALPQAHAGALHPDGGFIHSKFLLQIGLLQSQQGGHDLCGAGHGQLPVDLLRE